jgi:hypothetical protein
MPINQQWIAQHIQAANVFVNCTVPAAWASMTHSNGTPTGGTDIGGTDGPATFQAVADIQGIDVQQVFGPVGPRMVSEQASIVCTILETSYANLLIAFGQGTGSTPNSTNLIELGGREDVPTRCVVLLAKHADEAKYDIWTLYKAVVTGGVNIPVNRGEPRRVQVTFMGIPDHARPAGDQLWQYVEAAA